jgi:hypothetical protein
MGISAIPWGQPVFEFGSKQSKKGSSSVFIPKGKIALVFLKNYWCFRKSINITTKWQP